MDKLKELKNKIEERLKEDGYEGKIDGTLLWVLSLIEFLELEDK
jgi:hypothetical protein